MKEPIQQSGHEVSIVIYDAPLPPRYLKFSKKFIRTIFVVVPIALGLTFLALIIFGFGLRLKDTPAPTIPTVTLSDEDSRVQTLEAELEAMKNSNVALQEKLSGKGAESATEPTAEEPFLMGIKKPYGMQNLISQNKVTLGQFEMVQDSAKSGLKFQIISTNPETKVTGHVLVFMISDNGMMVYPASANSSLGGGVKYSMGEPFSVSRLRPTHAEFNQRLTGENVKFVVYIFSREGDLLLIKETESYKLGAK